MNTHPPSHPRLFFSADEIVNLRNRSQQGIRARLLHRLEQVCSNLTNPDHPDYFDFREQKRDIWRQRHGIFTVNPALAALAAGHIFLGKAAFGEAARDAVMTIIEQGLADRQGLTFGNPTNGWRHGPGHDKGKFALALAWVYDACYDCFSPGQRARFAEYAKECIALGQEHHTFDQAQIANNRGIAGVLVPTIFGLALEGDFDLPDLEKWISSGIINTEKYLFLSFDSDGATYEGPGYAGRIGFVALIADAIRRRGGPNLLTHNRFERYLHYLLFQLLPGGGSVDNLNDARLPCGSVTGCLHLLGTDRGALIPWLIRQLDLHPKRIREWLEGEDGGLSACDLYTLLPFLLWWDDNATVRTPQELGYPVAHVFPTRGVASLRTGWERDDSLVTHFCGRQELYCHRQGDYNHINYYSLGEAFLIDAGYGSPFNDPTKPVNRWFGLTESHNCVLLDGMNQRGVVESPGWTEGQMLDFQSSDAFDASLGDASATTGPDHRVRRSLRRVALVKAASRPFLVVLDVNEKDGQPFLTECLWTTDPTNRVEIKHDGFTVHGRENRCHARVHSPTTPDLRLADSQGRPQVRVAVRASVSEILTVFHPLRDCEVPPALTCVREGEGRWTLAWEFQGQRFKLGLSAVLAGPLGKPEPCALESRPTIGAL